MSEYESTPHPGRILLQRAMEPLGISRNQLARDLDVPVGRISDITNGKRGITADTALRLGRYFSTGPEIWLRMQAEYDLSVARTSTWSAIEERVRVLADAEDGASGQTLVAEPLAQVPADIEEPVVINPVPPPAAGDAAGSATIPGSDAAQSLRDPAPAAVPGRQAAPVLELRETWGHDREETSREEDIGIPPVPGDQSGNS